MARVLALTADLLFGSRLQGALAACGHDAELMADEPSVRVRLTDATAPPVAVLVVDLTDPDLDGAATVESLRSGGELASTRTVAFYSHVDLPARARAELAGFDLVVPRSRMAREGPALVGRLAGAA